jgi:adenylate cyclase
MGQEIERKFLVKSEAWRALGKPTPIRQGYLASHPGPTVRVRIAGEQAWLTIKSPNAGVARSEFEYAIPLADASEMLETLCGRPLLDKQRTHIEMGEVTWEVDEFFGENLGLIVAEVELESEGQVVALPEWIGEEVTGDSRYYNSSLLTNPFSRW